MLYTLSEQKYYSTTNKKRKGESAMIKKSDIINEVVCEMGTELDRVGQDKLKTLLLVKLHNFELISSETLPSVDVRDNEWVLKRYSIDLMASGREKSTIKQYLIIVRKFFNETGLNYTNTTGQDITDYLAIKQYKDKISLAYKCVLLSYISAFFAWAYRKHHIDEDIMRDVDKIKRPKKKKERLSDEEVARCKVVAKKDKRDSALLELMLSTGMRVGEICGLDIENIDFQNKRVIIWGEKSNEERTGFLSPDCKVALLNYIGDRTSGPVFIGKRGKGRLTKHTVEHISKSIAEKANCSTKATVHIYRKTFASVTYRRTSDILLVSKLLGHASTDVTIRHYLVDDIEVMESKMKMAA